MKKITKKKMTIEDIALSMNKGFRRVENLIEKKIDELAISTAKGFEKTATKDDVEGLKNQIQGVNNRIDDISMNRVKYEDHNKLKIRVDFIERKLEIKK